MRIPLIAGNWKMNGTKHQAKALLSAIHNGCLHLNEIEIVVLPPFVYLPLTQSLISESRLRMGAQNLYIKNYGAFTGEVSAAMLADVGCAYVLVGHSERRSLFHEDLSLVAAKFKAAVAAKLRPILCVGETESQRKVGKTERVIEEQVNSVIEAVGMEAFAQAVIAYEPVWAIGTGLTATPDQAEAVHAFIRQLIAQNNVDLARTIRILYGGSMKADNAASLLQMPNIDGGLIGGASLEATSFLAICARANEKVKKKKIA